MKQTHNNILTILFFSAFIAFSSAQVFVGNFDFNDNHQTHFIILEDGKIKYGKIIYKNYFGYFENRNSKNFVLFLGFGASWFNDKNIMKFGIQSSPIFAVFNFPVDEFNQNSPLPFVSYSKYF